jgi:hypothetical protein
MMETKLFELRDSSTFIPIIAIKMSSDHPREHYLLRRAGYSDTPPPLILVSRLSGGATQYDPYAWNDRRTFPVAHQYIEEHWDSLETGAVIDVRTILGETATPAESEQTAGWL